MQHSSTTSHVVQADRSTQAYRKRQVQRRAEAETEADDGGGNDEDKALYCICKQPSAGFMVACDNRNCPIEWFHGTCVGVTSAEVENRTWYCSDCRRERERKKLALTSQHSKPDYHPYASSAQQHSRIMTKKYRKPQ